MFKQHTNDFSVMPNHGCDSTIIECINITDSGNIDVSTTDFSINNSPFHIENISGAPITIQVKYFSYTTSFNDIPWKEIVVYSGRNPHLVVAVKANVAVGSNIKYFR